jgi:hypothetical protein
VRDANSARTDAYKVHHKIAERNVALFFEADNLPHPALLPRFDEQRIERGGKARQAIEVDGWPIERSGRKRGAKHHP